MNYLSIIYIINKMYPFYSSKHPFSQWYRCDFTENGIKFSNAEQYMMYRKAVLFKDEKSANEILKCKIPSKVKAMGRKVKNFDYKIWNVNRELIVYEGNMLKFEQNQELLDMLVRSGDRL